MYGLVAQRSVFCGNRVRGAYQTPDGMGRAEKFGNEWIAWRTDNPGVTATTKTLKEAAAFALGK